MIEQIVIGIIFIMALGYLLQVVRKNFSPKQTSGCAKGCGTCSASEIKSVDKKKPVRKVVQV